MAGDRVRRLVTGLSSSSTNETTNNTQATRTARSILNARGDVVEEGGPSYEDLWHCVDACMDQSGNTKTSTRELANTLQQWAVAEKDFIKAAPYAKKKMENLEEAGTIGSAIEIFCQSFPKVTAARSRFQSIVAAMAGELQTFRKEQNNTKKKIENDIAKLRKGLVYQEATFLRAKNKYEKSCSDAKDLILLKEKTINEDVSKPHDVGKLWQRTTDAVILVRETEREYKAAVDEVNQARLTYKDNMKLVMRELQLLEESRSEYIKAIFHGVMDAYTDFNNQQNQALAEFQTSLDKCDAHADIKSFVTVTRKPEPEAAKFIYHRDPKIEAELETLIASNTTPMPRKSFQGERSPNPDEISSATGSMGIFVRPATTTPPSGNTPVTSPSASKLDAPRNVQLQQHKYVTKNSVEQNITFVKAMYNYASADPSELSFKKGDLIEVTEKDESGWWEGQLSNGRKGSFPENYTTPVQVEEPPPPALPTRPYGKGATIPSASPVDIPHLVSPGFANVTPPTSARQPPMASVVDPDSEFASNQKRTDASLCTLPPKFTVARVLFDYAGVDASDLPISRDQILTIHGVDEDGQWLDASNPEGRRGMVPANYVASASSD